MVATVNQLLGILTLAGNFILVGIILLSLYPKIDLSKKVFTFISNKALVLALIVATASTLGSLFYSDIAGYEPCKLCWFQRIFMYPQVILLVVGILSKDKKAANYGLALSLFGVGVATYHYLLQLNLLPSLACSTVGYSAACSQRFVMQFGYITIPLMSVTAFLLIIFFLTVLKLYKRTKG